MSPQDPERRAGDPLQASEPTLNTINNMTAHAADTVARADQTTYAYIEYVRRTNHLIAQSC